MFKLVVLSALLAVAAARPSGIVAAAAPLALTAPVATAITGTVQYASTPVVTGYTSQVIKPSLGALATPLQTVSQISVAAPARTVAAIQPQIALATPALATYASPAVAAVAAPGIATYAAPGWI